MDFDLVRLFVAVVDEKGIAAAARTLDLSPSLASRRIASLEAELGVRLLVRTTRSIATTPAGAALLSWARSSISDWGRIRDEIGAIQGRAAGLVRLATNDYAAVEYLPRILAEFVERQPDVQIAVSITQEPTRLLDGQCDLAIHAGRRPDADLVGRRLWEYERRLVASPSYLARRGAPRTLYDLASHSCLMHTISEPSEWYFEDSANRLVPVKVRWRLSADSWTMLLRLALAGAGIARLSDALVRDAIADGRLVELFRKCRSVYPDGDPPAMWVLAAHEAPPLRIRLLADHIAERLLAFRTTPPG